MGVSVNGFATKASKEIAIKELEKACKLVNPNATIVFEREAIFEELIQRKRTDNIIDIYTTRNGSILIISHELFEKFSRWELSKSYNVDYFDICETSMSHRFARFSDGKETECMNIWDSGSTKDIAGQNYLDIKQDEDVFFSAFPRLTDKYTEQTFHQIELDSKIERYNFVIAEDSNNISKNTLVNSQNATIDEPKNINRKSFWKRLFS